MILNICQTVGWLLLAAFYMLLYGRKEYSETNVVYDIYTYCAFAMLGLLVFPLGASCVFFNAMRLGIVVMQ